MSDVVAIRERTRFAGPAYPVALIERVRLDDRYVDATGRILRVLGPGGYGKSNLVARWVQHETRPVRWLDLEGIDNDPLVLGSSLVRALHELSGRGPVQRVVADLGFTAALKTLLAESDPFVLVLDDVHHVDGGPSSDLIDMIGARLPAASTLVLVGRAHRSAGIGRLRLGPGVVDVTVDDLAFDRRETASMLAALGVDADDATVSAVAAQFEGWPAGLRLASMAMRGRHDGADPPWTQLGRASYVTEYITAEWLPSLGTDDRTLVMEAGCLDRFSGDMCDAVLGRRGSASDLRRLVRDQGVVFPLDEHDGWYRMHPVLRDHLAAELRDHDRERWMEIQTAAAAWWERHGDIDLAIEFADRAGDIDRCQALIATHGGTYLARGLTATVRRWLARFGEAELIASPSLCAFAAVAAVNVGDGDRAVQLSRLLRDGLATAAERAAAGAAEGATEGAARRAAQLRADVLRGAIEPAPVGEAMALLEGAIGSIGAPDAWRSFAGWALGSWMILGGDARAIEVLDDAGLGARALGLDILRANLITAGSLVSDHEGRRDEAERRILEARDLVGADRLETHASTLVISAAVALSDARAGRYASAREAATRTMRTLDGFGQAAPWGQILARHTVARALLLLDEADDATQLLRDARAECVRVGPELEFVARIDAVLAEIERARSLATVRGEALTPAELNVLQFLPTNLSLAEIAARLYVSRNTVKSQAAAIYRKLGVASRSQAVQTARTMGLLSDERSVR